MDTLKDKAISLLARREHTRRELQQKLQQRGFALLEIFPLLDNLESDNLLNEERFIGSFIRMRRVRGMGPLKVCIELQKRGIDRHRILANEEWQEAVWQESAIVARMKRFGDVVPRDPQERLQQTRFLQQRGYTSDQIRIALKISD